MKKNKISYLLIFFVFLSLLKIDYRFVESINCCGDDHDYYMHAETIANDFDFDYRNQMQGIENKRYDKNGKIAPTGFLGSGLLASPFLFVGNQFNNFSESRSKDFSSIYNFKILFYSFSPIFYLLFSILLLKNIFNIKNYPIILISIFGSGITYYAFERYSMTPIYELFSISLVIFCCKKYYNNGDIKYAIFIPMTIMLAFLIRWVNYFVLFIPFIVSYYENPKKFKLTKSLFFISSSVVSFSIFLWFSKKVYGIYTINPQDIYGRLDLESTLNSIGYQKIFNYFLDFLKINFSQEFGILWFNPPVFFSFIFLLINLIYCEKNKKIVNVISLISYLSIFGLIVIWGSTAASYGYRYMYGLLPLSIYLLIKNEILKNKYLKNIFIIMCLFSFISTIFFETTELTQLSLVEKENIFGNNVRFTQPEYLKGFLLSIFNIESYLKIISTSFVGVIVFKILISTLGKLEMIEFLNNLKLPTNNPDFLELLNKLEVISFFKIGLSIFFIILFLNKLNIKKNFTV